MRAKQLYLFFVVSLLIGQLGFISHAQDDLGTMLANEGLSVKDVAKYTNYYYKNESPDKLLRVLNLFLKHDNIISDPVRFDPFAHLIATIAQSDKKILDDIEALRERLSAKQIEAVDSIISQAQNFQSPPADSLKHVDYLWAEFSATGKDGPIIKIIGALSIGRESKDSALLVGAVKWSLESNAKRHKKIIPIIKRTAVTDNETLNAQLSEIIDRIEK